MEQLLPSRRISLISALFSTSTGKTSSFDINDFMVILSEIDTLPFVNNKDIFLDNLFKLAAFQCLVQVDMGNNPPARREAIMVEQHVSPCGRSETSKYDS